MVPARRLFKSKLHRITVTEADRDYEGSVTVDVDLLEAADILPYEQVHIWNVTRGTRLTTYALGGARGSGVCCINGAAAHLVSPGDIVIIATFTDVPEAACAEWKPTVIVLDAQNRIKHRGPEIPGPQRR